MNIISVVQFFLLHLYIDVITQLWLISGFDIRETQRMPLVE